MPYTFTTREQEAAILRMTTRFVADSYEVSAEFSDHAYDPLRIKPPLHVAPIETSGVNLTLRLSADEVEMLKSAHFRVKITKAGESKYIDFGRLTYEPLPSTVQIKDDHLYVLDRSGKEFNAGYARGPKGESAKITIGAVVTGSPGSDARVVNSGDESNAQLDFTIPRGDKGDPGEQGIQGVQGVQGPIGPAGLDWKGTWKADVAYDENDSVFFDGSSWFASEGAPAGTEPSLDVDNPWQPLAIQGVQGVEGPQGLRGDPGASTDPAVLDALDTRLDGAEATLTGATDSPTANTIARRNNAGDSSFNQVLLTSQSFGNSATRKDYVDAIGATDRLPNTVVRRDASSGIAVDSIFITNPPASSQSGANRAYVDAVGTNLPTANTIMRRDANGNVVAGSRVYSGGHDAQQGTELVNSQYLEKRVAAIPRTAPQAAAIYPQSGAWFPPTYMRQGGSDVQPPVGQLNAQMLVLGRAITLASLTVQVGTAGDANALIRLGVYADAGDGYPGALLLDAGTVSGASAARVSATTSLALTPGVYWLSMVVQGATTIPLMKNSTRGAAFVQMFGDPNGDAGFIFAGSDNGSGFEGFRMTGVTGALPANFSTTRSRITAAALVVGRAA